MSLELILRLDVHSAGTISLNQDLISFGLQCMWWDLTTSKSQKEVCYNWLLPLYLEETVGCKETMKHMLVFPRKACWFVGGVVDEKQKRCKRTIHHIFSCQESIDKESVPILLGLVCSTIGTQWHVYSHTYKTSIHAWDEGRNAFFNAVVRKENHTRYKS